MREIKFRGETPSGVWVYGDLIRGDMHTFIAFDHWTVEWNCDAGVYTFDGLDEVNPATIGQFTGLQDRDGVDVYEGDLLDVSTNSGSIEVTFQHGAFCIGLYGWHKLRTGSGYASIKVIGNIHDIHEPAEVAK